MRRAQVVFWSSVAPFLFSVFLIAEFNPNVFGAMYLTYFVAWAAFWRFAPYSRRHGLNKKHFWIGLAVIVVSVPIQTFVVMLYVFGTE